MKANELTSGDATLVKEIAKRPMLLMGMRTIGEGLNIIVEAFKNTRRIDGNCSTSKMAESIKDLAPIGRDQTQALHIRIQYLTAHTNSCGSVAAMHYTLNY
ncbi:hypothetical protein GN958_ATG07178 [Phytophthora infestans]|uniref:Uncharacterized protein n=1 Tax=Phytophthora infestans TaxID=4787 RepID=A0A8S9UZV3_PHYIN|nr:hypothetical protein GN958_ATG07178 [Phytophthora infestans]